jgi:N-carbamoyl-L-amino-acid hydrolase
MPAASQAVKAGAERLDMPAMSIIGGAGTRCLLHDPGAPTGMTLIPCEDGIRRNEIENTTREDCGAGADVLLRAMVERANTN